MSRICLHCLENVTTNRHMICDPCYNNAGDFLEANVRLIKAIPFLIDACHLALAEIDQWNEVMGGSEDPRTDAAIKTLEEALANTH